MKLLVTPHLVNVKKSDLINEKEINITKCEFEFTDDYTSELVKEAIFTYNGTSYKVLILNNECNIPSEVINEQGEVEIGVVAYKIEDNEYIKRFNPTPAYISSFMGSIKDKYENSSTPTPSEVEQLEQEIQNGLEEIETVVNQAENLDINITTEDEITKVVITRKDGSTKEATVSGGGTFNEVDPVFSASASASITNQDINNWNNKSNFSGNYNDLANKPTNVSSFTNDAGYTTNTGTITSIKMNGNTISSSGEANLGTVITSHQDISGKLDTNKVKTTKNTTQGNVYDVTYINSIIGDIETLLSEV